MPSVTNKIVKTMERTAAVAKTMRTEFARERFVNLRPDRNPVLGMHFRIMRAMNQMINTANRKQPTKSNPCA